MEEAQDDWISKRTDEAEELFPVPAAVAMKLKHELAHTMHQRPLRTGELNALADALIAAAKPPPDADNAA